MDAETRRILEEARSLVEDVERLVESVGRDVGVSLLCAEGALPPLLQAPRCEFKEPDHAVKVEKDYVDVVIDMPGLTSEEILVVGYGRDLVVLGGLGALRYYKCLKLPGYITKVAWNYARGSLYIRVYIRGGPSSHTSQW